MFLDGILLPDPPLTTAPALVVGKKKRGQASKRPAPAQPFAAVPTAEADAAAAAAASTAYDDPEFSSHPAAIPEMTLNKKARGGSLVPLGPRKKIQPHSTVL
jgi:hypothetical protein